MRPTTRLPQARPPIQRISSRQQNPRSAEIEGVLRSHLEKTGFPFAEIERLKATRAAPGTLVTLDHPMTIELFNDEFFLDFNTHVEPFNSFAQLRLETHTGFGQPTVAITYEWINPKAERARINVGTLLRLTGLVDVKADASFFGAGHFNQVQFSGQPIATRGTGWGTDPSDNSLDGTRMALFGNTFQDIGAVTAQGGLAFDDDEKAMYTALPVGLGVDNVLIPGHASILFGILFVIDFFYGLQR